jgi:trk system potassium uptake protein TrkA
MIKYLATTDAEVLEFVAHSGSKITAQPLRDINFPKDAIVGGLVRDKAGYIATGNTWIKPGDHVVIFSMPSVINDVSKLFE